MIKLEVGKPLQEGVTHYKEGIKFDIDDSGALLQVFYSSPTAKEVKDFKTGTFSAGITVIDNVIFFMTRFGLQKWQEAPYNIHLSKNLTNLQKIEDDTTGYNLLVTLTGASNGILKVARMIGLDNLFSKVFYNEIQKQKQNTFDPSIYAKELNRIFSTYSPEALADMAIIRV